jgi:Flp pilus assembly protein TadD
MWAYVRFVRCPKIANYLPVVVFLALGLMSKPMLVTLPFVLLLLDYWPLDRFSPKHGKAGLKYSLSSLLIEKVPLFAMVAASSVVTFIIQKKGGALLEGQNYSFIIRLANAFISYVQYIVKMIYPIDMTVIYPHAGQNISIPYAVISAIFLLAVTILVFRFAKKQRYLVVGWLWYLGTLVPVIGLIQVGRQAFADRYTYISLTGLFIIIAWGIPELLAKWRYKKIALTLSGLFVILALSICTHFQLRYWQNSLTLFQHALDVTGDSHLSHFCIAEPLREQGKLDEAIYHYKKAIELNPYAADVYLDLGTALTAKGKFAEAIFLYNKALQIAPDLIELRINLGVALTESGKLAEAVKEYEKILRIQPGNVFINNNLGAVFLQQGKFDEAIEYFSRALQIDPDSTLARDNLNRALAEKQKIKSTENTKE